MLQIPQDDGMPRFPGLARQTLAVAEAQLLAGKTEMAVLAIQSAVVLQ